VVGYEQAGPYHFTYDSKATASVCSSCNTMNKPYANYDGQAGGMLGAAATFAHAYALAVDAPGMKDATEPPHHQPPHWQSRGGTTGTTGLFLNDIKIGDPKGHLTIARYNSISDAH
jgi:hypothetical protein